MILEISQKLAQSGEFTCLNAGIISLKSQQLFGGREVGFVRVGASRNSGLVESLNLGGVTNVSVT
jgi:hypothetical protein